MSDFNQIIKDIREAVEELKNNYFVRWVPIPHTNNMRMFEKVTGIKIPQQYRIDYYEKRAAKGYN